MASGSAVSFASLVLAKAVLIVNSVVIARTLGAANLGLLAISWNVAAIGVLFATFGIPTAVAKLLAEKDIDSERASQLVTVGFLLTLLAAAMASTGLVTLAPLLANGLYQESDLIPVLWIGAAGLAVGAIPSALFAVFQGFQRIGDLARRNIVASILSVPLTVTLVLGFGLLGAAVASVGSGLVGAGVSMHLFFRIWREKRMHWGFPVSAITVQQIGSYAFPIFLSSLVVPAAIWIANTFLILSHSKADFGQFTIANSLAGYLLFVPAAVGIPFLPMVSEAQSEGGTITHLVAGSTRAVVLVTTPVAAILILFARPLVDFLYGPAYTLSSSLILVTAVEMVFVGVGAIIGYTLAGIGKPWNGLILNLLWASTLLPLAWVLVPRLASLGLAFAYLASYAVLATISLAYGRFRLGVPYGGLAVPSAIAVGGLAASIGISMILEGMGWITGSALTIGVLLLAEWRAMSGSERKTVLDLARKVVARP